MEAIQMIETEGLEVIQLAEIPDLTRPAGSPIQIFPVPEAQK